MFNQGWMRFAKQFWSRCQGSLFLKATYDSGVSVAEMDVTARGKIVKDASGSFALQVNPNRSYQFVQNELSQGLEPLAALPTVVKLARPVVQEARGEKETGPFVACQKPLSMIGKAFCGKRS